MHEANFLSRDMRRAIDASTELARKGEEHRALEVLDTAIASANGENSALWSGILNRHAAALAEHLGDLPRVRRYCEQSLAMSPASPLALFCMADILRKQGEEELARQNATQAYRIGSQQDTEISRGVIELLLRHWPDLSGRTADEV